MKKTLLIISLLMITILSTFSQEKIFEMKAISFRYSINEGDSWTTWNKVSIPVVLDFQTNRFVIYSTKEQILDFVHLNRSEEDNCITLDGYATDSNYKKVVLVLTICEYNSYLSIMYDDIIYTYELIDN